METKKYWQAVDKDGEVCLFHSKRPELLSQRVAWDNDGQYNDVITFPVPLKPLQIAEITVCEDGTWSYEIEREEGWYMARVSGANGSSVFYYKEGRWFLKPDTSEIGVLNNHTISPTRIPDECII